MVAGCVEEQVCAGGLIKYGGGKGRRERRWWHGNREESVQNALLHHLHAGITPYLVGASSCLHRWHRHSLHPTLDIHLLRVLLLVQNRLVELQFPLFPCGYPLRLPGPLCCCDLWVSCIPFCIFLCNRGSSLVCCRSAPVLCFVVSWTFCLLHAPGAYFVCEIPSLCHGHYLGITVILGIASMAFLSAKAGLYNTFDTRTEISPVAAVEGQHHLGFPLLLISSCVFALVHIVVGYKSWCQARRKLAFFSTDPESVSSSSKHSFIWQALKKVSVFLFPLWYWALNSNDLCGCRFWSLRSVETHTQESLEWQPLPLFPGN